MSYATQLLDTYPRTFNVDAGVLAATIDALNDCAQACTADADDDLSEQNLPELVKCIRLSWTAPTSAPPPSGSQAARPSTTPTSPGRCWRPARPVARAAATNANGTPASTSTAGSAPRCAAVPSRLAGNY